MSVIIKPVEEIWDDIFEKFISTGKLAIFFKDWLKQNYEVPKKKQ